jgi:hypothetical protein
MRKLAFFQPIPEGLALDIFHDDVVLAVLGLRHFMDMANIRMVNGSGRLGFSKESLMGYRIGMETGR